MPRWCCREMGSSASIVANERLQAQRPLPLLELHFDVNMTILMSDAIQQQASQILSATCYGLDDGFGKWVWDGKPPRVSSKQGTTYDNFLWSVIEDRRVRSELVHCFTDPGQPGEPLRERYDQLLAALRLPEAVVGTPAARAAGLNSTGVGVVPAFFQLLLELQRRRRRFLLVFRTFGEDLAAIAREVNAFCTGQHPCYPSARLDGSPQSAGYDLRLGSASSFGCIHLDVPHGDVVDARRAPSGALVPTPTVMLGTVGGPGNRCLRLKGDAPWYGMGAYLDGQGFAQSSAAATWQLCAHCAKVATTLHVNASFNCEMVPKAASQPPHGSPSQAAITQIQLSQLMQQRRREVLEHSPGRAFAIRDDYVFWAWHKALVKDHRVTLDPGVGGKALLIDPAHSEVHPIFFDDNVGWEGEAHIVDARHSDTGSMLPYAETRDVHLPRSEPLLAVGDPDYFVKLVDAAEEARRVRSHECSVEAV